MPTRQRLDSLIQQVEQGKVPEALRAFYAENVTMQENDAPPTVGLQANLEREQAFLDSIAELIALRAESSIVEGDRAVIHWLLEFVGKDGVRRRFDEIALQTWEGDRIVHERFVYDTAKVEVSA